VATEIREFQATDYDAVVELWRASPGVTLRDADAREPLTAYIQRNAGLSFVATNADHIVDKCHLMAVSDNHHATAFWTTLGWVDRADIRLMSHTSSGVTTA